MQFRFDLTPALSKKPVLSPDDPGRSKPIGPFVDPPDEWIIARFGQTHKLILNKYCVYRPMLILHTTLFVPQTHDLDVGDLTAAWAILRQIETPQMIIYNCGVEAGSSQGHKHIQIFPRQDSEEFPMFPSKATSTEGKFFLSEQILALGQGSALKYSKLTFEARCRDRHLRSAIYAFRHPSAKEYVLQTRLHAV